MATEVLKQRKKQINLIFVFFILIVLVFLIYFLGIKNKKEISFRFLPVPPTPQPKTVEINFGVLDNPAIKELEIGEEIQLPEERGRDNPFIPYQLDQPDRSEEE